MPGINPGMTMRDAVFDFIAMAGLVPAIHVFGTRKSWMPDIKRGMTAQSSAVAGRRRGTIC